MVKILILALFSVLSLALRPVFGAGPTIEITSVPPYGVNGFLHGVVEGADVDTHQVAVYIQIEGLGWWTKPTDAMPCVPIDAGGAFTADVATGGIDNRATIYCAALVEATEGCDPPRANGYHRIPSDLEYVALDCMERYGRTLEFAGFTWAVKEAPLPVGPGENLFSDRPDDVFVDEEGLHLTINSHDGSWWATEVILLDSLGYGTYAYQTNSRVDDVDVFDVNATFGAFTWDPYGDEESVPNSPHREIDFEDTRWGNPADPTNAQMVVQRCDVPGNLRRYTLPDLSMDAALTRFFVWQSEQIEFVALRGHHSPCVFPPESIIDEYVYVEDPGSNHFVPTEGRETFRFNLWLNNGRPTDDQPLEVVITDFRFIPASDFDEDGVFDECDNCILAKNGPLDPDAGGNVQRDTNGDGIGNSCDPDLDDDCVVNFADLALIKQRFFTPDPDADLDGDGVVNFADLAIMKAMFFGPPGPSGDVTCP